MSQEQSNRMECGYQKELQVSWKKPEGGSKIVILKLKDGDFYSLENAVSIAIWEQLMAGKRLSSVLEYLTVAFSAEDPAKLAGDLDAFVGDLIENRLICPRPQDGVA